MKGRLIMGYYTRYNLTADNVPDTLAGPLEKRVKIYLDFLCCEGEFAWYGETTWYEWREDMIQLSREFPRVLFKLHGEGDTQDDFWDAYFQNGKSQVHKGELVIASFDPSWGETTSDRDNRLTKQLIAASRVNPDERYCDDMTIYRNDMGGYSSCIFQKGITSVQTIPVDMFLWNHDGNLEEYLTLREVWEQAQKFLGRRHPVLYVWVNSPLRGEIYQCGNCPENPHWILHGVTDGYA